MKVPILVNATVGTYVTFEQRIAAAAEDLRADLKRCRELEKQALHRYHQRLSAASKARYIEAHKTSGNELKVTMRTTR